MKKLLLCLSLLIILVILFRNAFNEYFFKKITYIAHGDTAQQEIVAKIKQLGMKEESDWSDKHFMLQIFKLKGHASSEDSRYFQTFSDETKTTIWVYYEPITFMTFTIFYNVYVLEETSNGEEKILHKTFAFSKD